jgi:predicted RNase H-like HicB family nuclease
MAVRYVLTDYVERALSLAVFERLEDNTYAGRIPPCPGVLAFAPTLRSCKAELRSTLEDWLLVGLKLGHPLPVLGEIDLNKEPVREPVGAL